MKIHRRRIHEAYCQFVRLLLRKHIGDLEGAHEHRAVIRSAQSRLCFIVSLVMLLNVFNWARAAINRRKTPYSGQSLLILQA